MTRITKTQAVLERCAVRVSNSFNWENTVNFKVIIVLRSSHSLYTTQVLHSFTFPYPQPRLLSLGGLTLLLK